MTLTKNLVSWGYEQRKLRTIKKGSDVWFVAQDVAEILGIVNIRKNLQTIKSTWRDNVTISYTNSYHNQETVSIINEPALYMLIFRSRKEEAHKFQEWVAEDVIPAIRKTGKYEINPLLKIESKEARNHLTDELKNHGIKTPIEFIKFTSKIKKCIGIKGNKKKELMDSDELKRLKIAEDLIAYKLEKTNVSGYNDVKEKINDSLDGINKLLN